MILPYIYKTNTLLREKFEVYKEERSRRQNYATRCYAFLGKDLIAL